MTGRSIGRGIACALLLANGAAAAEAAAWRLQAMGIKALGSAYAGVSAEAADASTVWFNPAGLTELGDGWTVTVGAPVIDLGLDWRDAGSTSLLGQPLAGLAADGGDLFVLGHAYAARKLGERAWFGLGFNTPYGLGTRYGREWVGRYHADETTLEVPTLITSLGWRVHPRLAVGVGLEVQAASAVFSQRIDFGSIGAAFGLPLAPQGHDGGVHVEGEDEALGWNAGLLWTPRPGTRIGLAWHAGTTQEIEGDADFTVPAEAAPLTAGGLVFADTGARTELPMPATANLSFLHRLTPRWVLLADLDWTDWSRFEQLRLTFDNPLQPAIVLPTGWSDTLRGSLGARFEASDRWTLRGGLAYEENPIPAATREPRVPEAPHQWVMMGASWHRGERATIDLFIGHLFTDRATMTVADPSAGTLRGEVDWEVNEGGVAATWRF